MPFRVDFVPRFGLNRYADDAKEIAESLFDRATDVQPYTGVGGVTLELPLASATWEHKDLLHKALFGRELGDGGLVCFERGRAPGFDAAR